MAWTKTKTAVVAAVVLILAAATTTEMVRNSGHHSRVKLQPNPAAEESFQQASNVRFDQAKKWALAFFLFAGAHGNQFPSAFAQAKTYVPGLSEANWEMVSGGDENSIANPALTILLRERESRQSPDGTFAKVYAFADGHAELLSSPDADFAALEKQRGLLVRPAKH